MKQNKPTAGAGVPCMHKCKSPRVATVFLRWHPLKEGYEIRRCPNCGRDSAYPTNGTGDSR